MPRPAIAPNPASARQRNAAQSETAFLTAFAIEGSGFVSGGLGQVYGHKNNSQMYFLRISPRPNGTGTRTGAPVGLPRRDVRLQKALGYAWCDGVFRRTHAERNCRKVFVFLRPSYGYVGFRLI